MPRPWLHSPELTKFLAVGGISYLVNQASLILLYEHAFAAITRGLSTPAGSLDLALLLASALAVEISIVARFVLNDSWTFRDRRHLPLAQRFMRSNLSSIGSPAISLLAVNILTPLFGIDYLIANSIGVLLGLAWNWVWSSQVVWRRAATSLAAVEPEVSCLEG